MQQHEEKEDAGEAREGERSGLTAARPLRGASTAPLLSSLPLPTTPSFSEGHTEGHEGSSDF